jgi:hypothetical protein
MLKRRTPQLEIPGARENASNPDYTENTKEYSANQKKLIKEFTEYNTSQEVNICSDLFKFGIHDLLYLITRLWPVDQHECAISSQHCIKRNLRYVVYTTAL